MKKRFLVLFFLLATIISVQADDQKNHSDPLLIIVLMVKNESSVMRDTLQPYVDTITHDTDKKLAFFIFDTGSTDDTIAVTHQYFQEKGVQNAVIQQEPFVDFETSRNKALDYAQAAFPQARFMLMPDAEWYMHNVEGLLKFCELHQHDIFCRSYLVRIMSTHLDFYTPRLIRCHSGVRFVGKVHEVLNHITHQKVTPPECYFEWRAGASGIEKSRQRWLRDVNFLLQEYEKNPHDPRTVFYLAQTYDCLNDHENACKWYKHRTTMPGWDEENFMTHYRLAQVFEAMDKWDQALIHYLEAYSMRPHRAEPLVRLAEHYRQVGQMDLCFLFTRRATEIPYPQSELLSIDKLLYSFTRYDLLGISAWYVQATNEHKLGKEGVLQALKAWPDAPHLHNNLRLYEDRETESSKSKRNHI